MCRGKTTSGNGFLLASLAEKTAGCGLAVWNCKAVRFVLLVHLCVHVMGCSYALVHAVASHHPAPTLALVSLLNQTYEPEVERQIKAALQQEFVQNQRFLLVSPAVAQWHLAVIIKHLRTIPITFDRNDNVLQYQTAISVVFRLTETMGQKLLLSQEITAKVHYLVVPGGGVREEMIARETASLHLAQQLANQCADLLVIALL